MMNYHYTTYRSPFGEIHLLAGSKGLRAVGLAQSLQDFKADNMRRAPGEWVKVRPAEHPILNQAVRALDTYFKQGQALHDVPLELQGTPFQIQVWKALGKIPYGKTSSYGQIAAKVGKSKAARAVGTACGANPLALFVPCHRVVGGNGGLCGFGGGLDMKRNLLDLETKSP
jgi:methylated-DNA-[protein]-cysteine S-methyltransferase